MESYKKLVEFYALYPRIVIALGMFDGIHLGHQRIIKTAVKKAHEIGGTALVFSFLNHPRSVVDPEGSPRRIDSDILRQKILKNLGVDVLVEIPFTPHFAKTDALDFVEFLHRNFAPKYIVIGENYTFGRYGRGTPVLLRQEAGRYGFQTIICPPVICDGETISSTCVRKLIQQGNIAKVNEYLGYPFSIMGIVVHGKARGRQLGFPTANIELHQENEILSNGVYAVTVQQGTVRYGGVANIGNNPTFEDCKRRLEVHIFDFFKDIYGENLTVSFYARIRKERRFSSIDSLIAQIECDKKAAISLIAENFHLQENISMII
ncbi:bifunctional riboflavin kinase/FAD synthetase [Selenomonas sp. F0473]|uniref:bifunctional riboflavin kinase/FAD synthetase n=1 Tax=Selenomonas sp. F0473 TaxID=999423 RepID=UPI00029DEB50|nr:bifunctional riboflavin kinase/FAD synthetase [Selenomonas sp. F0473]EKU71646.1 riboflavin biosynthesis protein RibF [Selenomonas sp. F0473]